MTSCYDNLWLENIFHHVFLPPKLPGSDDERQHEWESSLTLTLINALKDFGNFGWRESDLASIRLAAQTLISFRSLNSTSWMISAPDLTTALSEPTSQGELTAAINVLFFSANSNVL